MKCSGTQHRQPLQVLVGGYVFDDLLSSGSAGFAIFREKWQPTKSGEILKAGTLLQVECSTLRRRRWRLRQR